jgi:FkbM family methyltransferase
MRRLFLSALAARMRSFAPLELRNATVHWLMFSDRGSRRAFRQAYVGTGTVSVRLRALGGKPLLIRRGTDDPYVLRATFTWEDQLPPQDLQPRVIVDVGANIGVSMALYAARFPEAQVVGIEPEAENAELCRRNVEPWGPRCQVVQAAAWTEDGVIHLDTGRSTSTHAVGDVGQPVEAVSLRTIADRYGVIDFLKLDIEGGERTLLADGRAWAESVRCISVETHAPYTVEQCQADLSRLGFQVSLRPALRKPCVVGRRHSD